jgi:iron complex transport system substrate-binding protein
MRARSSGVAWRTSVAALLGLALALPGGPLQAGGAAAGPAPADGPRLVVAGADLTEIVFALGAGGDVVAVDDGSKHPAAAAELPRLGYVRALSAEGILSQRPDRVLVNADAGPPTVLAQVRSAGVAVDVIPGGHDIDAACAKLRLVGALLDRAPAAEALAAELAARAEAVVAGRPPAGQRPRVLFLYARGPHSLHVAGRGTPADAVMALAGGRNAVEEFEGYRQLSGEAVVAVDPDLLLVPAGTLDTVGGLEALLADPALALTRAARERRVVAVDDAALLGFGPRLADALERLAEAFTRPESDG